MKPSGGALSILAFDFCLSLRPSFLFPAEAAYFADQNGIFECYPSGDPNHGTVMRQMIPLRPITWGGDIRPHSLVRSLPKQMIASAVLRVGSFIPSDLSPAL